MTYKTLKAIIVMTTLVLFGSYTFSIASEVDRQSVEELDQLQAGIEKQNKTINDIKRHISETDGILKKALEARLTKAWLILLEENLSFAKSVAAKEESGTILDNYSRQAIEILGTQDEIAYKVVNYIKSQIKFPEPDMTAADMAAAHSKVLELLDSLNRGYELLIQSLTLSREFKIDVTEEEKSLKRNISELVANGSILLEFATQDVTTLSASVAAVPDDKELKAKLTVASHRVRDLANKLNTVLVMMDDLGMDSSAYKTQVLAATGQITTDFFNFSVINNLLMAWWQSFWNAVQESGPDLIFKMLLFLIIVYVFRKLAIIVQKIIEKALAKSDLQFSELLRRMVLSIARNTIIVLGLLIALSQVGISLGPLLAGLGVVGFIIGFALQDLLSNFAAGMMILIYRPFDVGDLIDAGGVSGKVNHMSLVNTTVLTLDNQTILIPNSKIWGDVVKNVTAQTMRRVDMMFGISYSDDIPKTERVLNEILNSHEKILADPEPIVRLHELGDSSVNFVVRPWVEKQDYWDVYWDITRSVKMRFDEEGISIPFPQRDVHMYNQ